MTADLIALADWLDAEGVGHVAMESTGVYWKPVFHILEGRFEVILANAHRIKNVPGRKTDVKDAEWIAQLLQYGLIEPSFLPPPPIRELRDLTRQRARFVAERASAAKPGPQGPGGRQHQAVERGDRRPRGLGAGDARRLDRRRRRPGGACGPGAGDGSAPRRPS